MEKQYLSILLIKNLGDYHDLYVQSDTLLADVFENFRNMCNKVYELDPAHFLTAPGLAWQACLEKSKVKLELLTGVDKLLMVEKGVRGEIRDAIYNYEKANNKYMRNYHKDKKSSFLQYLDANNLDGFKWKKKMLRFNKKFIKNYNEDSIKGYILEVDVKYPINLNDLPGDLPFLPERIKIGKCNKLVCNLYDKKPCCSHKIINSGIKSWANIREGS